jgi:hypothetical protein
MGSYMATGPGHGTEQQNIRMADGQMTLQRDTPLFRLMDVTTPADPQDATHSHELCQSEGKYRYYTEMRGQFHSPAAFLPVPTEHEAEWTSELVCCPCRDSNPGPSSPLPSHYTDPLINSN